MAVVVGGIRVDPVGLSCAVNITQAPSGAQVTAYTAIASPETSPPWQSSGSVVSFPTTITTPTIFYITTNGPCNVSVQYNGQEVSTDTGAIAQIPEGGGEIFTIAASMSPKNLAKMGLVQAPPPTGIAAVDTTTLSLVFSANAGKSIIVGGNWTLNATIAVPAGTLVRFNNATITAGAAVSGGLFSVSAADVSFRGQFIYNAAGFATPCFVGSSGGDRFDADVHANFKNANTTASISTYLFQVTQCNGVKIRGLLTSSDGTGPYFVYVDRGSYIDISGVVQPVGLNASSGNGQFSPVMVTESTGSSTCNVVNVHDCLINGGATINSWPLIWIGSSFSAMTITTNYVNVANCTLLNTTSTADALDVVLSNYVTISNINAQTCYVGVDITAVTAVTVTNCICALNRGYGYAAGDPNFPVNTLYVTFNNCQAHGNGNGANTAQYLVYAPNTKQTNSIHFYDCNADALSASAYELIITGGGGTVSDVQIEGGNWSGGSSGHINDTISGTNSVVYRARNARGINPFGNLAGKTPTVPSSTSAATNNTGYDCSVTVFTGAGVTVSVIAIGGTTTGYTLAASGTSPPLRVPAGQTITLTYAGGTPTWSWFGD